ncbi:MAG: sterol desaturase family protein [Gammaproteobacteria bacterium]|nr:sterol desaturase family protein [Gammaproteobacteria bacterium]
MELANSPMTRRQFDYRQIYRERVAAWYNGFLHVALIYTIGLGAMYVYAAHIHDPLWWEWLTLPVVFLLTNLFEWFIHAQVMHRPRKNKALRAIYTRHTLMHHQFFTDTEMRFAGPLDWRVTFFPPYALIVFILMSAPAALIAGWLISPNTGWLMMCATTGVYLIYEFMHFCCHVDENRFVRHCPMVNTMRRHHTAHHRQSNMMRNNMNLTFPIADWLFGTSDLNRGLFGHLFNGYNTDHIKRD